MSTSRMRSSILAFNIQAVSFTLGQLITVSSASSLTVHKSRSLSLSKGPFPNRIFTPSLTHPALKDVFCFRGFCFLPCICFCLFRVFPCSSVANASASFRVSASVFSVSFRVRPWLMLLLCPRLPSDFTKYLPK